MVDVYAYEVAQEQEEEQRRLHRPMKEWFAKHDILVSKFGEFPQFWRDLGKWPQWKEVFRVYNRWLDLGPKAFEMLKSSEEGKDVEGTDKHSIATGNDTSPTIVQSGDSVKSEDTADLKRDAVTSKATDPTPQEVNTPEPPKRRRRWGEQVTEAQSLVANQPKCAFEPIPPMKPQQNRWGTRAFPSAACLIPPNAEPVQELLFLYRVRVEEYSLKLATVASEAIRISRDPRRSPSPPAKYDSTGKRINSREQRMTKDLLGKRDAVLEKMVDLNPTLAGPSGPRFVRKVYIPWREYPNYNFIGLVIGPRGVTQKRLEQELNCKISVRGQGVGKEPQGTGSSKNTAKPKKPGAEEDDEQHVHIQGESLMEVEAAALLIADLLTPVSDENNEWKKRQLLELAAVNGTLRDLTAPCTKCGEVGHRHYECPYDAPPTETIVRCVWCGDASHVSSDCKMHKKGYHAQDGTVATEEDAPPLVPEVSAAEMEYLEFMAQMNDEKAIERLKVIEEAKKKLQEYNERKEREKQAKEAQANAEATSASANPLHKPMQFVSAGSSPSPTVVTTPSPALTTVGYPQLPTPVATFPTASVPSVASTASATCASGATTMPATGAAATTATDQTNLYASGYPQYPTTGYATTYTGYPQYSATGYPSAYGASYPQTGYPQTGYAQAGYQSTYGQGYLQSAYPTNYPQGYPQSYPQGYPAAYSAGYPQAYAQGYPGYTGYTYDPSAYAQSVVTGTTATGTTAVTASDAATTAAQLEQTASNEAGAEKGSTSADAGGESVGQSSAEVQTASVEASAGSS